MAQLDPILQQLEDDNQQFQQWLEFERRERAVIDNEKEKWNDDQMSFDDWLNTPEGIAWFESELDAYDESNCNTIWIGENW